RLTTSTAASSSSRDDPESLSGFRFSHRLLRRQFFANNGHRVLAHGGMSNLNLLAQENQFGRSLILARPALAHAFSLSPPGPHRRRSRRSFGHAGPTRRRVPLPQGDRSCMVSADGWRGF